MNHTCPCSGKLEPLTSSLDMELCICSTCHRYYVIRGSKPEVLLPWRKGARRSDETCRRCLGPTDFDVRTQRRTCKDQLCRYSWCESQNSLQASRIKSMHSSCLEKMATAAKNGASQEELVGYATYISRLKKELEELYATHE